MDELAIIMDNMNDIKQFSLIKDDILLYINTCYCNAVKIKYSKEEDDIIHPSYIILYIQNNKYYVLVGGYYKYVDYDDGWFTELFDEVPETLLLKEYKILADACKFIIHNYTYMFDINMCNIGVDLDYYNELTTPFYNKIIDNIYYEYDNINNIYIYSSIILDLLLNEYHIL